MKLAIVASHPVQYYAPLYRELSKRVDLTVFYGHQPTDTDQARAGFGVGFQWDVDLTSGYDHRFLTNTSHDPNPSHFSGVDTPDIYHKLKDGGFDGVLVMGWYLKTFWQSVFAAKRLGIPVLVRGDSHITAKSSSFRSLAKALAYPVMLRSFDAALYVGELNHGYYRHYRFPESRLFHSPHAIDTERFAAQATQDTRQKTRAELGVGSSEKLVLFSGKLIPVKEPLDAVRAVAQARQKGHSARLVIAGSGPLEGSVQALAAEQDVPLDRLGFVNQSRMPGVYAAADALILPSKSESWGLVCNEALACGLPVVVSERVGCAPDVCTDPNVGRTFPFGDTEEAGETLARLFENPPSRERIAAVSQKFSLRRAAEAIAHALSSVVQGID